VSDAHESQCQEAGMSMHPTNAWLQPSHHLHSFQQLFFSCHFKT
jgi:hypothetical protein